MSRRHRFRTVFALFLILLPVVELCISFSIPSAAAQTKAATRVRHEPISYFVPEHRIAVDARVTDKSGIDRVRCYFKADMHAEYVFVPMAHIKGSDYRAVLPAPAPYSEEIQYLFLAVNQDRQVVKTQAFFAGKAPDNTGVPEWQTIPSDTVLTVYIELAAPPETVHGFSDSLLADAVESSLRFGVVAGLYPTFVATSETTLTGAAASAVDAGSVSAATGSYTTVTMAAIAGAAAGAGILAAAEESSGGGGEDIKINPNAMITWGDESMTGDVYHAVFRQEELGTASYPARDKTGLPVGVHELAITAVTVSGETGRCMVLLRGGAFFQDDGSTRKTVVIREGESAVYPVFVPDTGSARIEW